MTKNWIIQSFVAILTAALIISLFSSVCAESDLDYEGSVTSYDTSHASDALPDYETVFPDDVVQEI